MKEIRDDLARARVKNPFDALMRFEAFVVFGPAEALRSPSARRSLDEPQAGARISGSPPIRRANSLTRDRSRSLLSGARSAGKDRITRPFEHAMGARGNTPGIAAEML
jgi:transcriptional regulator of acetoin/glycerol metabolism